MATKTYTITDTNSGLSWDLTDYAFFLALTTQLTIQGTKFEVAISE